MSILDDLENIGRGARRDRPLDVVKFAEMEPRLAGKPLIKGYLEREQISLIVGEKGCGKTFFALDRDLHIAAGCDWHDRKVRQAAVVYVAAEAGRSIVNRVVAWRHAHSLDDSDIPFAAITTPVDLCHPGSGDVDRIIEIIKKIGFADSLGLVEIDTVNRAMAGGDENAPDDMGGFIHSMDQLRTSLRCHVAGIHHFGKDTGRGSRGHSSLVCAVDTETQIRDRIATITNQRDGIAGTQFPFELKSVLLGYDEDDEPVTTCIIDDGHRQTSKPRKPLTGISKLGLDQLHRAVDKNVTPIPYCDEVPNGARGCEIELWKKCLRMAHLINPDGNEREQFRRMNVTLSDGGYIKMWGEYVWLLS